MRQLLQDLKSGDLILEDVPAPANRDHHVIVRTDCSLISSGTEKTLYEFGRAGYIGKARQQPEKVSQALRKIRTDGVWSTYDAIKTKIGEALPLGYSNVGTVVESAFPGLKVGDRVVSNGFHAEVVRVPGNLCALVPAGVSSEHATFTVVGAIALQAVRLLSPTLGERVGVIGVGLIGQLCIQILSANGCKVLAVDTNEAKLATAMNLGATVSTEADDVRLNEAVASLTNGDGLDGVIIATSSTSDKIIDQAATSSRKRGRVILVGAAGMTFQRDQFYKKELTLQVSSSYGPGRYDPQYEAKGIDYPLPFVRWTAQRNFETVLDLIEKGQINIDPLISHRFEIHNADQAYQCLYKRDTFGIVFNYPGVDHDVQSRRTLSLENTKRSEAAQPLVNPRIGFLGSGNYSARVLLPTLSKLKVSLETLVSTDGARAHRLAKKSGFANVSTDEEKIWADATIDTVFSASKHHHHASQVIKSLCAKKNIFVEKPLAISLSELEAVEETVQKLTIERTMPYLMVDFNRRFAPLVCVMKKLIKRQRSPKAFIYTVNAGTVPDDHWVHDPSVGGGRIVGEVCHFIDLVCFLSDSKVVSSSITELQQLRDNKGRCDTVSVSLTLGDGSIASIHYLANSSRHLPKERIEVSCAGQTLILDNFLSLKGYGWPAFQRKKAWRQNKGNQESVMAFIAAVSAGGPPPIPLEEIFHVSRVVLELSESTR